MSKQNETVSKSDLENMEQRILAGTGEIFQALIGHMDERFEQVDRRFEQVDQQFIQLKQELKQDIKQVDTKLNAIDRKLDNTIERTDDHSVRISKLENKPA